MPRGKKRAEPDEPETEQAQKFRSVCKAVDDSAAEFLCPITQELPIDPVMAEDGRTYERSAIEKWLREKKTSPHTNEPMGERLIPALQVKNAIATMVKSGALSGDKCEAWTKKLEHEEEVAKQRAKAEAGDVKAMKLLGFWYRFGIRGLAEDPSMSFSWYKRAADLDDVPALMKISDFYRRGIGTETDEVQAIIKLTHAAVLGGGPTRRQPARDLVNCYAYGVRGVKKSASDALYWAKKVRAYVDARLEKLPAGGLLNDVYTRCANDDLDAVKKALAAVGIAGEW